MRSAARRSIRYLLVIAGVVLVLGVVHARRVQGAGAAGGHDGDEMGGHMTMTALRPIQPGDRERADAVAAAARRFADRYTDYHQAIADGYKIFLPELPQKVYHFTRNAAGLEAVFHFNPEKPTSLLYEKTAASAGGEPGYKLVGVMYTDGWKASDAELDKRIPLSVGRWHLHTNLCLPPKGEKVKWDGPEAKFGLRGSITTEAACKAEGGKFMPHLFGWMVHVYPYETDPAKRWSAGMDDEHGMQRETMPGMPMGPGMKM